MLNKLFRLKNAALSGTAKDTYILFIGNTSSAFLGFVYTLFIARALTVSDFGVFSAIVNLVIIIISVSDIGLSSGVVNFVSEKLSQKEHKESDEYIKASLVVKFLVTVLVSVPFLLFPSFISGKLLATSDYRASYWVAITSISLALPLIIPFILQAKKRFIASIVADNSLYVFRLVFMFLFMAAIGLTVDNSMFSYALGGLVGSLLSLLILGFSFWRAKPTPDVYKKLLTFSGWIGVNRVVSTLAGKLDIQMLIILAGTAATGLYAIPSRLAGFVYVLAGSFSAVLATRMAGFKDKEKEKEYIIKATLALLPITVLLVVWVLIARPFILLLFGEKYLDSVPIFRALILSMIPFMLTAVPVTAIIYAMKKTKYIGLFSFFQLAATFVFNLFFITQFGALGPAIVLGIVNIILAVYTWSIVIRYYWS